MFCTNTCLFSLSDRMIGWNFDIIPSLSIGPLGIRIGPESIVSRKSQSTEGGTAEIFATRIDVVL